MAEKKKKKYDSDIVGWYTRGGKRVPVRSKSFGNGPDGAEYGRLISKATQGQSRSKVKASDINDDLLDGMAIGDKIELPDRWSTKPTRYTKRKDKTWEHELSTSSFTEDKSQGDVIKSLSKYRSDIYIVRKKK